jgi:hypothetical protein
VARIPYGAPRFVVDEREWGSAITKLIGKFVAGCQ